MPGLLGTDLAASLERAAPKAQTGSACVQRLVFMSGYAEVPQGTLPPGVPFIQKPFSAEVLLRTVRNTIDGVSATPMPFLAVRPREHEV